MVDDESEQRGALRRCDDERLPGGTRSLVAREGSRLAECSLAHSTPLVESFRMVPVNHGESVVHPGSTQPDPFHAY